MNNNLKLYKPMQKKTINQVITKKINDWINSIQCKVLQAALRKDVIVTGGCIPSMMLGEKVNDFDIYIKAFDTLEMLVDHYLNEFKEVNDSKAVYKIFKRSTKLDDRTEISYKSFDGFDQFIDKMGNFATFEDFEIDKTNPNHTVGILVKSDDVATSSDYKTDHQTELDKSMEHIDPPAPVASYPSGETPPQNFVKYIPTFLSENAITLSDKIQIVTRFWGEAKVIHSNYDFLHVQNYWTFQDGVVMNMETNEAIRTKVLNYTGSKYPVASVIRSRKFIQRGWTCTAGQYLKMMLNLQDFDLTDFPTLRDQLTGVDLLYFEQFLATLDKEKIQSGKIDNIYLIEMLDRFF